AVLVKPAVGKAIAAVAKTEVVGAAVFVTTTATVVGSAVAGLKKRLKAPVSASVIARPPAKKTSTMPPSSQGLRAGPAGAGSSSGTSIKSAALTSNSANGSGTRLRGVTLVNSES